MLDSQWVSKQARHVEERVTLGHRKKSCDQRKLDGSELELHDAEDFLVRLLGARVGGKSR